MPKSGPVLIRFGAQDGGVISRDIGWPVAVTTAILQQKEDAQGGWW
jgi:hypothetical protein